MHSFYLASGRDDIDGRRAIRDILVELGYHETFDWTTNPSIGNYFGLAAELTAARIVEMDLRGVACADFLVAKLDSGGRGTHMEIGAALVLNKRVFLFGYGGHFGNDRISNCGHAFYWAKNASRHTTMFDLLGAICLEFSIGENATKIPDILRSIR